jgi:glyoxylase I family protein
VKFSHVALNCRDLALTQAFYQTHLGFGVSRVINMDGGARIVFLKRGEVYLELFSPEPDIAQVARAFPDGPHGAGVLRHLAFQVDDLDAALRGLGEAADLTLGPLDFSAFIPGWKTAWIADPDGVVIELSQGYQDALDAVPETVSADRSGAQASPTPAR